MDRGARQTTVHEFARVGHNLVTKPPPPMLSPRAFQVAPVVKNLSAVQETGVLSLGQKILWRSTQQPIPVFLPGESHGQRSLVGYSP